MTKRRTIAEVEAENTRMKYLMARALENLSDVLSYDDLCSDGKEIYNELAKLSGKKIESGDLTLTVYLDSFSYDPSINVEDGDQYQVIVKFKPTGETLSINYVE